MRPAVGSPARFNPLLTLILVSFACFGFVQAAFVQLPATKNATTSHVNHKKSTKNTNLNSRVPLPFTAEPKYGFQQAKSASQTLQRAAAAAAPSTSQTTGSPSAAAADRNGKSPGKLHLEKNGLDETIGAQSDNDRYANELAEYNAPYRRDTVTELPAHYSTIIEDVTYADESTSASAATSTSTTTTTSTTTSTPPTTTTSSATLSSPTKLRPPTRLGSSQVLPRSLVVYPPVAGNAGSGSGSDTGASSTVATSPDYLATDSSSTYTSASEPASMEQQLESSSEKGTDTPSSTATRLSLASYIKILVLISIILFVL